MSKIKFSDGLRGEQYFRWAETLVILKYTYDVCYIDTGT